MGRLEEIEKLIKKDRWGNISTKGSEYLLSEVHRLRKAIEKHRTILHGDHHPVIMADIELYKALEEEE
jgi:hypothetical protein